MKKITHEGQQKIWEEEHRNPYLLPPMDSEEPSSGVALFLDWLKEKNKIGGLEGIEMCCGKGRNCIYLARSGIKMTGIDFSVSAIKEAIRRSEKSGVDVDFQARDVTISWPFPSDSFDFVVDCFASTDIESLDGRLKTRDELIRVLKPSGYLFLYTLSTDDEYHKKMIEQYPAEEQNAFCHPSTGKFEKSFSREELMDLYKGLKLVEERRVKKIATFFGKPYNCLHFWIVFQKQ